MPLVKLPVDQALIGPEGPEGPSAYDVAVANGFVGTEAEWLLYIQGEPGPPGQTGPPGPPGDPGSSGLDGASAYEIAVDNGYTGTEAEWIQSLKATLPAGGQVGDVLEQGNPQPVWTTRTRILVLSVGEPVPPGTVAGTVILRRET